MALYIHEYTSISLLQRKEERWEPATLTKKKFVATSSGAVRTEGGILYETVSKSMFRGRGSSGAGLTNTRPISCVVGFGEPTMASSVDQVQ